MSPFQGFLHPEDDFPGVCTPGCSVRPLQGRHPVKELLDPTGPSSDHGAVRSPLSQLKLKGPAEFRAQAAQQGCLCTRAHPERHGGEVIRGRRAPLYSARINRGGRFLTAIADPASLSRIVSSPPTDTMQARRLLERFKGIKLCLEPEIGIEFSGKWLGRGRLLVTSVCFSSHHRLLPHHRIARQANSWHLEPAAIQCRDSGPSAGQAQPF